jgi:hypothetical protein
VKVSYDAILKGIQFVIDHKDDITAAVKEGKDLIDWLREKFGAHDGLTIVEQALLVNAINDLVNLNESQAPPLTPPPVPPAIDPTTVEYTTVQAAILATSEAYPFVINKPNGRFIVWPRIGPFPGVKVYPADAPEE